MLKKLKILSRKKENRREGKEKTSSPTTASGKKSPISKT